MYSTAKSNISAVLVCCQPKKQCMYIILGNKKGWARSKTKKFLLFPCLGQAPAISSFFH